MKEENRAKNARRRAITAMGATVETIATCGASRHALAIADTIRRGSLLDSQLVDQPDHCATSIYEVLEALWKARAEIKRLKRLSKDQSTQTPE